MPSLNFKSAAMAVGLVVVAAFPAAAQQAALTREQCRAGQIAFEQIFTSNADRFSDPEMQQILRLNDWFASGCNGQISLRYSINVKALVDSVETRLNRIVSFRNSIRFASAGATP